MTDQPTKLPEDFKKLWIEALRSGKYKQGRYGLCVYDSNHDTSYCCLGVACQIANVPLSPEHIGDVNLEYPKNLPRDECEKLSEFFFEGYEDADSPISKLVEMNDSSKSFETIADYIEKEL